jgi:tetratricopeptide (TPR) repeat protein
MLSSERQGTVRRRVKFIPIKHLTPESRLTALGSLSFTRGGETSLAGRRKLLALLTYLVRREGRGVGRGELAALFWPEADESRGRQSLRQALVELRAAVGESLEVSDREVRILPGSVQLDAARFEQLMDDGEIQAAVALWRGDFLEGGELSAGEELRGWIETERQQLRRRRAWAGEALVREAESRGAWHEALVHAEQWAAHLPGSEEAAARVEGLRRLGAPGVRAEAHPGGMALLTPDLVAREADFAILTGLWERVERGSPGLALIEGEDGSGKSRLLEEFLRWAKRRDDRLLILRGRAFDAERDRPLLLARHLLAPLANAAGVAAAPAATLRAMAQAVPEFTERYPQLPPGKADDLQESVARVLAEAATEAKIVLAVDDVHLADRPSRELLESLLRRPVGGVLVVLTTAPEIIGLRELERRPAAAGQLYRVRLGPLDQDDLERALASMAEFRPQDRAALARRLLAETGGNPLAAVELATALADHGIVAPTADGSWIATLPPTGVPLPLPTTFTETMAARLRELPANATRTLQAAAVLARNAEVELLLELTGFNNDELDAALSQLLARRLLRAAPDGANQVEFTHEALRRTVYEALSPVRRGELHAIALAALRRRAPRNSAAAAALSYHQERAGIRRPGRSPLLIGLGAVMLLAIGLLWASRRRSPPDGPTQLAIVPWSGASDSASRDYDRLANEALALALIHAKDLSVVEASLLDVAGGGRKGNPTLLLESHVESSGAGLHLRGVVRRATGDRAVIATAMIDGQPNALPELAARLAARLFPDQLNAIPFELSAAQTTSVPALQSYFSGLRLARHADMEPAAQAFWQATRRDRSMAAAWHALSRINAWYFLSDRSAPMADTAAAHVGGLLAHEVLLFQGWAAFANGRADDAEGRFRQALAISTGNVEATIGLAEVLQHHNRTRGRSPLEARPLWEQVVRADPTDWRPHAHLWELPATQGDWPGALEWLTKAAAYQRDTTAATRLILSQLRGDTAGLLARVAQLPADNEWGMMQLAEAEAVVLERLDVAAACLKRLTEPGHPTEVQAFAREQLAHLALAQGRWREAMQSLAQARALEPVSAATTEALLWVAPFLPPSLADSGRRGMRERLRKAPLAPVRRTFLFWFDLERAREPLMREYLDRVLGFETGRSTGQAAFPASWGGKPDSLSTIVPSLRNSLAAWRSMTRDTAEALAILERSWEGAEAGNQQLSPFWSRPWDHYMRAEALEKRRPEMAANLFQQAGALSLTTLPYTAPGALREGRIREALGDKAGAIRAYRRVVQFWSDADPEFRSGLEEAQARLKALGAEPS